MYSTMNKRMFVMSKTDRKYICRVKQFLGNSLTLTVRKSLNIREYAEQSKANKFQTGNEVRYGI